jgi:hypothetical protein
MPHRNDIKDLTADERKKLAGFMSAFLTKPRIEGHMDGDLVRVESVKLLTDTFLTEG